MQMLKMLRLGSRELFQVNGNTGQLPCRRFFPFTLTIMTPSCSTEELLLRSKLHPHLPGILLLVVLSVLLHVHTFDPLC